MSDLTVRVKLNVTLLSLLYRYGELRTWTVRTGPGKSPYIPCGYDVDFAARTCTYYRATGEEYVESYPTIEVG